jgi:hypothetical protein
MIVELGKDGIWCASGRYIRPIAAYAPTRKEAMKFYAEAHYNQQCQEYAMYESMSGLVEMNDPNYVVEDLG